MLDVKSFRFETLSSCARFTSAQSGRFDEVNASRAVPELHPQPISGTARRVRSSAPGNGRRLTCLGPLPAWRLESCRMRVLCSLLAGFTHGHSCRSAACVRSLRPLSSRIDQTTGVPVNLTSQRITDFGMRLQNCNDGCGLTFLDSLSSAAEKAEISHG